MADAALADFQERLDTLADLDTDALTALQDELVAAFTAADEAEAEEATLTEFADAIDLVKAEIEKKGEGDAAPAEDAEPAPEAAVAADGSPAAVAEAPAPAAAAPAAPAPTAVPAEAPANAVDISTEAVTAPAEDTNSLGGTTVTTASAVQVPSGHAPVTASAYTSVVTAGGDIPGISAGAEFKDGKEFGKALADRVNAMRNLKGGDGEQIIVASIKANAPAERTLVYGQDDANLEKIREVTELESITAAGGFCAPLATKYDLYDCGGVTDRPVKDALAGFQAERGGIRFYSSPALGDLTDSVGFWTSSDDLAATPGNGADGPYKACARIDCPTETTAEIQAVTMCLTFGVVQGRVFPETVVANNKLAMVAHARLAESALLAQIKAGSKKATEPAKISAVRDILDSVGRGAIWFRDRYRLNKAQPMRAILPAWVLDVLRGDIALGEPVGTLKASLSASDSEIEGFFRDRNINVTWALDSAVPATNGGGFFSAFTGGNVPIPAWPTSLEWALYPEGAWLFLDGGQLDLGIVRDSTLVKQNDYMQFSETFERATLIGCESFWITQAISLTGRYNGPIVDPAFLAATAANA